jgi:hypothetical protein
MDGFAGGKGRLGVPIDLRDTMGVAAVRRDEWVARSS